MCPHFKLKLTATLNSFSNGQIAEKNPYFIDGWCNMHIIKKITAGVNVNRQTLTDKQRRY